MGKPNAGQLQCERPRSDDFVRTDFYVGYRYVTSDSAQRSSSEAFVRHYVPKGPARRCPIVLIHGGWLTGSCYEVTADGRPGWAPFLASQGYHVYVMDQPARGRSPYDPPHHGPRVGPPAREVVAHLFTKNGPVRWNGDANAVHRQWPGSGGVGDPLFDRFYASLVPELRDRALMEQLMRAAGGALLDTIGPAYVLTHSQSGPHGWHLIDARPHLVRALVAVEPHGPPFYEMPLTSSESPLSYGTFTRPYGITATAVAYEAERAAPNAPLTFVASELRDNEGRSGYLQREPARVLRHFDATPILVVTGSASYHTVYDHWTVAFMRQAHALVTHLPLATRGIEGNGHLMMLENNSDEIASEISDWFTSLERQ